jgi:hypothetical protein
MTSSASVSEMSYQSNGAKSAISGKGSNDKNSGGAADGKAAAVTNGSATTVTSGQQQRHRRSSAKTTSNGLQHQQQQQQQQQQQPMALSRHRSSGCLQSRHCHSTLSLSRARSSSALNRVQSRSMNLLMIQTTNQHGMKTTSSDVLSVESTSTRGEDEDDEEDEGVATDATTDGKSKDIKTSKKQARPRSYSNRGSTINKDDGLSQGKTTTQLIFLYILQYI